MRWLKENEEGAVAVVVAMMLIVLFGLGALVVDVGNLYWERRQLQRGADAAALAAAQDMVEGESQADAYVTARFYADANNSRGAFVRPSTHAEPGFVVDTTSVTVTAHSGTIDAEAPLPSILSGVLGVSEYATQATAVASWGFMGSANTVPLTFSQCEWEFMTGGSVDNLPTEEKTIYFHKTDEAQTIQCGGPANQDHAGGFGWLTPQGGKCEAYVENGEVGTDVGNNVPNACTAAYLESLLGQEIVVPIFESVATPFGNNAVYQISGFAVLEFTGYSLSGNKDYRRPSDSPPCDPPLTCISGNFLSYSSLGDQPVSGGQDFGAYFIGLTG